MNIVSGISAGLVWSMVAYGKPAFLPALVRFVVAILFWWNTDDVERSPKGD